MNRPFKKKRKPPRSLVQWLTANPEKQPWSAFSGEEKENVRRQLHLAQQGLCCYCYTTTPNSVRSRIEHIEPQNDDNRFEWSNLALACDGGERADEPRHCDVSKGNQPLDRIHPYDHPVLHAAALRSTGRLKIEDDAASQDIQETLNLNSRLLMGAREAALRAWTKELPRGDWRARDLKRALDELRERKEPVKFHPWLEQWLERRLIRSA